MILCSCTRLTTAQLRSALCRTCQDDPWQVVTPGQAFRLTSHRIRCGRCAPLVAEHIAQVLSELQTSQSDMPTPPGPIDTFQKGPDHER